MNHLIGPLSLVGILSTSVVYGIDMFFLTVGRPALRLASPSAVTEVMGFIHSFGDARMPIWGIMSILSNLFLALFGGSERRGFYFASLAMLILFVVIYNLFVKANQSASNRSGKNGRKARQCSRVAGVVGSIVVDPYSAARCLPAYPVPGTTSYFGVNALVSPPFKSQEKGPR